MEKEELKAFLYFFIYNKNLTRAQQQKRDMLFARDIMIESGPRKIDYDNKEEAGKTTEFKPLSALSTAHFLSMFNDPMGLKYLTHDFDPINDNRPQTLEALYNQVKNIINLHNYQIPKSLWSPINSYIEGENNWLDTFGGVHKSYINDPLWVEWSAQNKMHPINNPAFSKEIMAFRSTIRLVSPSLKDICDNAKKGMSLIIKDEKLEKADFYTNTYILYSVIKRIFAMMNRRVDKFPEVLISFKRTTDSDGRMLRQIIISQKGSYADKSIEDIKSRFKDNDEAGDFGSIRNSLNGYCLWQVETLWERKPYRWNILKSDEMSEIELMNENEISGFTHLLTYYIV